MRVQKERAIFWWGTILGLMVFWVLIGWLFCNVICAQESDTWDLWGVYEEEEGYGVPQVPSVPGVPQVSPPSQDQRMIIYDTERQNPQEYQMRNQGNGTWVVEPLR